MRPDPKIKTARSKDYLDYIRSRPCKVCNYPLTVAAHTGRGGKGIKASDFSCIPLCDSCHREQHQVGSDTFAERHSLDYAAIRLRLMEAFIQERLA